MIQAAKTKTSSTRDAIGRRPRFLVSRARKALKFCAAMYAGIGLTLPRFQRRIIARLFGNARESGFRRYRWLYYSTPRKNAKSTLIAAISLFLLFGDGEPNPRVYYCATTLEQTAETFEIAERMLQAKPVLDRNSKVINSQNRKQIIRFKNSKRVGYILALTSRGSKEGKPPSAVIFDELCDWT
jgi:phage terminase large subunit-like protein